jgi:hypothetical protein
VTWRHGTDSSLGTLTRDGSFFHSMLVKSGALTFTLSRETRDRQILDHRFDSSFPLTICTTLPLNPLFLLTQLPKPTVTYTITTNYQLQLPNNAHHQHQYSTCVSRSFSSPSPPSQASSSPRTAKILLPKAAATLPTAAALRSAAASKPWHTSRPRLRFLLLRRNEGTVHLALLGR